LLRGSTSSDYDSEAEFSARDCGYLWFVDVDNNIDYTTGDLVLSLEEPRLDVEIRDTSNKDIESMTIETPICVHLSMNLEDDDVVKIKMEDPDGYVTDLAKVEVSAARNYYIDTTDWNIGTYEIWLETVKEESRGLDLKSEADKIQVMPASGDINKTTILINHYDEWWGLSYGIDSEEIDLAHGKEPQQFNISEDPSEYVWARAWTNEDTNKICHLKMESEYEENLTNLTVSVENRLYQGGSTYCAIWNNSTRKNITVEINAERWHLEYTKGSDIIWIDGEGRKELEFESWGGYQRALVSSPDYLSVSMYAPYVQTYSWTETEGGTLETSIKYSV
jgi:hypothetical protein